MTFIWKSKSKSAFLQAAELKSRISVASSNELWRASLDTIDFMPLSTANYSGGIIVTDWYSEDQEIGESIKITIRFLTNEVRSDAISIKVFYKKREHKQENTIRFIRR